MKDYKKLENKIVYFYKVHGSFFESSLECVNKPLKNRTIKIKSINLVEEDFYTFTFYDNPLEIEMFYNSKYNYFISDLIKNIDDVSMGYGIIADNLNSINKSILKIIKHKIKGAIATKVSFFDCKAITSEFYSFKQKLSKTTYFSIYPEDFL